MFRQTGYLMGINKLMMYNNLNKTESINNNEKNFLSVSCFGDFKVTVEKTGHELKWRTKKAQELFAYLIHLQGNPVGRKTLIFQLWPNVYPNNAVMLFHNIIYSIRKELENLGIDNLIKCEKRSYFLQMECIRSDIFDMLSLGQAIENNNEEAIGKYSDLLLNYSGTYFDNLECEWCNTQREYFEHIYIKGCRKIAESKIEVLDYETAIYYLKQILKVDPFAERSAATLIHCYRMLGDFKNMKKQYEKFITNYKNELDLDVSETFKRAFKNSLHQAIFIWK